MNYISELPFTSNDYFTRTARSLSDLQVLL